MTPIFRRSKKDVFLSRRDWETSNDPRKLVALLHAEQPKFFRKQIKELHRFLIACCWQNEHLIPQAALREGLKGAERYINGEISTRELNDLDWYAEAAVFAIEYARTDEQIVQLKSLISGVDAVRELPFEEAKAVMLDAAYFAEGSIIFPRISGAPWVERLFTSQFLSADLLREFVHPVFAN
ncbi:hypothetical protein [Qipengyuania vesicularis]|uniref:hypothetical protein n=1 Tax=Qipengyuania vesicularis TaxID=2867232 RepID=UPI001C874F53|nr:hypothetical protein [Qipengyuania vesicularis]MBX7527927.1 hypothetical protein [Qipengyuania vesicularis]